MTIAQRLHEWRRTRHVSLRALGVEIGVSAAYLSEIESGRKRPGPEVAEKIAKLVGMKVEDLEREEVRVVQISTEFYGLDLYLFTLRTDGTVMVTKYPEAMLATGVVLQPAK
jgi:transcriptional regulator with XRE-family HTH domain